MTENTENNVATELANCRCCGYEAVLDEYTANVNSLYCYICTNEFHCNVYGPLGNSEQEAREGWNFLMIPSTWTQEQIFASLEKSKQLAMEFEALNVREK